MNAANIAQTSHSSAWVAFTWAATIAASIAVVGGILILPLELWMRGYLLMGVLMLVQSIVTLTKTQRDVHEGARLHNRIEDARTEKLLMGVER